MPSANNSEARRRRLVSRLVSLCGEGVRGDALLWTVVKVQGTGTTREYQYQYEYEYAHPVHGKHASLTSAREAHQAAHERSKRVRRARPGAPPPIGVPAMYEPGSDAALSALGRAAWLSPEGAPLDGRRAGRRVVAPSLLAMLRVRVVPCEPASAAPPPDADWHAAALQRRHGYALERSPCIVLQAVRGEADLSLLRVVAVFATSGDAALCQALPGLAPLADRVVALRDALREYMRDNEMRPGLHMTGWRWVQHIQAERRLRAGYYPARTRERAVRMLRSVHARAAVVDAAAGICEVERALAPAAAAHRTAHAAESGHPGVWPGAVRTDEVPAAALGVSTGYVSPPHTDDGFAGMAEAIAWCSRGVPRDAAYSFAVVGARVVFDLLAGEGWWCGVRGAGPPGTPRLAPGHRGAHAGVGAVALNKADLVRVEARRDAAEMRRRLRKGLNPFAGSAAGVVAATRCEGCRREDRGDEMLLCDECNSGWHADCAGVSMPPAENFWCRECAAALQRVQ